MSAHDLLFMLRVKLSNDAHGGYVACITAWDANHCDPQTGHHRIDARLVLRWKDSAGKRHRKTIWKRGQTHCAVNRWTSVDGIEAKELVLSLFSMRPGDTDSEFFEGWTEAQLAFADTWGETLGLEREIRYCDENGSVRS